MRPRVAWNLSSDEDDKRSHCSQQEGPASAPSTLRLNFTYEQHSRWLSNIEQWGAPGAFFLYSFPQFSSPSGQSPCTQPVHSADEEHHPLESFVSNGAAGSQRPSNESRPSLSAIEALWNQPSKTIEEEAIPSYADSFAPQVKNWLRSMRTAETL